MGIWNLKISGEEKYEYGSDLEPNWFLLGANKISDILSESERRIENNSLNHKWCNKYDEQNRPYDIIIVNNRMQSTLYIKTLCLKEIPFEKALKTWTLDINKSQIEKQIENPVDYYICCIWDKKIDLLRIVGWIERKEVIKLIGNNEIEKGNKKYINIITNKTFYDTIYKIPLNKLEHMKTLFLKLGIDADFAKYEDTDERQNSLDFY